MNQSPYLQEGLVIVVVGASGHLARTKIYPSLLELFRRNLLPRHFIIYGFARTPLTRTEFCNKLQIQNKEFLKRCMYVYGNSYSDLTAYQRLATFLQAHEDRLPLTRHNRLFYLAVPPHVFEETAVVRTTEYCIY